MKAEREKRESILRAEGKKLADILVAEGHKASSILNAEAEKETAILLAEGEKQKQIKEAEGEAEAILLIQRATAEGIELINSSKPTREMISLRSLEAFEKVANGRATKIIIPSEIQNLAGLISSIKEVADTENPKVEEEQA
jgi:regulator of protease activity HflC (stomatin/prohibitin superfamily)